MTLVPVDRAPDEAAGGRPDQAPYVTFSRFTSLLDRLRSDGHPPQVFDQSFFNGQSGSLTAQQRGALKFLGLIDDERRPTDTLRELVSADEVDAKILLKMVAEQKYAEQIALGMDATRGQLAEMFRDRGLTGETVNKAIGFFVALAEFTEIPISPHFRKGAASTGTSTRRSPRRRKPIVGPTPPVTPVVQQATTPTSAEAQRAAYINMLMEMAQKTGESGTVQTDLLNRIERALGFADPESISNGGAQEGK